jgi:hypothetical protein
MDDLFGRRSASHATEHRVFTDRAIQQAAFEASLAAVRAFPLDNEALHPAGPRRNVLAFHGMGGIGKSSLRGRLTARFLAKEFSPAGSDVRAITADFTAGRDRDFEELLLRVRSSLGTLGTWRAFDLAFAAYWEERRPQVPLQPLADGNATIRRVGEIVGVGDQIAAAVETFVAATPPLALLATGRRLADIGMRKIMGAVVEHRLMAACPLFEQIAGESDLERRLALLPYLLAWDLAQIQRRRRDDGRAADVVIFFDTWEELRGGSLAIDSLEDRLVRMAYLMPNVLFVVLGREPVDWAEPGREATLSVCGPIRWPGLRQDAISEPRQHHIEELAPEDCETYLVDCRRTQGQAAIPPAIRRAIVAASEGLPFFLELAVTHYDTIVGSGRVPQATDFTVPFSQLVGRVITDLPTAERNLLCAAAVARSFDDELLERLVHQAFPNERARFLKRPFIRNPQPGWMSYRIHDVMRTSIMEFQGSDQLTWSAAQWTRARIDAADCLSDSLLLRLDRDIATPDDRARGLLLIAELVSATGVVPSGLPLILWRAQESGSRVALDEAANLLAGTPGAAASALRVACLAALTGLHGGIGIPAAAVRSAWEEAPSAELRDLLAIQLGEILDTDADAAGAEAAFRSVTASVAAFRAEAVRLEATLLQRRSRFADAMAACDALPTGTVTERIAREALRGRVLYWSGQFAEAVGAFDRSARLAADGGLRLWEGRSRRHQYLATAWGNLGDDPQLRETALGVNDAVESTRGIAQVEVAAAIHAIRGGRTAEGDALLAQAIARVEGKPGAVITWHMALTAKVACSVMTDRLPVALEIRKAILDDWRRRDTGPLWPWVSGLLTGVEDDAIPEPQWLPGSDGRSWLAVLGRPAGSA